MAFDPNSPRYKSSVGNQYKSIEELEGRNIQPPGRSSLKAVSSLVPEGGSVSTRSYMGVKRSTEAPIKLQVRQPKGDIRR